MSIVYQPGKIQVVKRGSDGSETKEFLNIEARHPCFDNEDGLLSMAFSPGFGVYIYGDYTVGTIWGLRYDYTARVVTAEGTLLQQPKNITSFAEDAYGEIYALMDGGEIDSITVPQGR
jgi:hypothetical protein